MRSSRPGPGHAPALAAARRAGPETRTGLLLRPGRLVTGLERRLRTSQADFVAPHVSLARSGVLSWAAVRGLRSFVWTVNHKRGLRALLDDRRVAAVITDRPREALALKAA